MSVVLMYHALYRGTDTSRVDAEDLPYAVSESEFVAQLDALAPYRVGSITSGAPELPGVVITFDDGHISNFDIAVPLLVERGLRATFFITSDFVGRRKHFCHAQHLARMADAGMVIGSHGVTHRFFDDMSYRDAEAELTQSKQALAQFCNQNVDCISFPGGRYTADTLEIARRAGYARLYGSGFGTVQHNDLADQPPLNRVAIRRHTSLREFEKIIKSAPGYYAAERGKQQVKLLVKKMLGNRLYHGLYKSLSTR